MRHLTKKDVWKFVVSDCDCIELMEWSEHVSHCDACLELARNTQRTAHYAADVLDSWSPAAHGQAYREWRIAEAVRTSVERDASLADRAARWMSRIGSGVEIAGRMVIDRTKQIGLASISNIPTNWSATLQPTYSGVASPEAEAANRCVQESSGLLGEGLAEEAVERLSDAVSLDARTGQSTTLQIERGDGSSYSIVADGRSGRAYVILRGGSAADEGRYVMLVPVEGTTDSQVSKLEKVECADYLLAEFDQVPDGDYWVEIEPNTR